MRHELTDDQVEVEDILMPSLLAGGSSRQDLERMMKSALGELSSACRDVLDKAWHGQVSEVMLVGGCLGPGVPAGARRRARAPGKPSASIRWPPCGAASRGRSPPSAAGSRRCQFPSGRASSRGRSPLALPG